MRSFGEIVSFILRTGSDDAPEAPPNDPATCFACDADLTKSESYATLRVCADCGFHYNVPAPERIRMLADEGTFKETNKNLKPPRPLAFSEIVTYQERLDRARERTGLSEAVVTGTCEIEGIRTAILALDFRFMGGSMGVVVGEKVARLFENARKNQLPTVAIVSSGGARVQEGILSLMQMAKTVAAAQGLQDKGLPIITVMANPTTGQVYASFANLADIILAEPESLMGFAPLRVAQEASRGPRLAEEPHTAEVHLKRGNLDRIVHRERLKLTLAAFLRLLAPSPEDTLPREPLATDMALLAPPYTGRRLEVARHPGRPTGKDYVETVFTSFERIHGDRVSGVDPALIAGLGYLAGFPVAVIATQHARAVEEQTTIDGRLSPTAIRKAQRMMRLAAKFHIPLISLIDTSGVDPSLQAEEEGLGTAIAETLSLMLSLPVPTVAAIVGEGGSEAALALGIADRVLMQDYAIYAPISPESAASTLYRDSRRAEDIASSLKIAARDCLELGIIEEVVPEPNGGAHTDPAAATSLLQQSLIRNLADMQDTSAKRLVSDRKKKFRKMGNQGPPTPSNRSLRRGLGRGVRGIRRRIPVRRQEPGEATPPSTRAS